MLKNTLSTTSPRVDSDLVDTNALLFGGSSFRSCFGHSESVGVLLYKEQPISAFEFVKDVGLRF